MGDRDWSGTSTRAAMKGGSAFSTLGICESEAHTVKTRLTARRPGQATVRRAEARRCQGHWVPDAFHASKGRPVRWT